MLCLQRYRTTPGAVHSMFLDTSLLFQVFIPSEAKTQTYFLICWRAYILDLKNVAFRAICWSVFKKKKKKLPKVLAKPSLGCHIALLMRAGAQSSCIWRHNNKSKVHGVFIAGGLSEIIKWRRYFYFIKLYVFKIHLHKRLTVNVRQKERK